MEAMTVEQALNNAKGFTFEQLMASFFELRASQAQTDAQIRQMTAKTDAQIEKMSRKVDKLAENVGGLNRSMGELIESLMTSRLWEKFNAYGHHLVRAYPRVPIYNEKNEQMSDIDILLSNTDECMAVEVKREADDDDIDHHLKRMKLIEKYPPAEVKGKKVYSAIAGAVVPPDVRDYAYGKDIYMLEMNGEQVSLLEPPKEFTAGIW
jgi:phage shock protein A